MIEKKKKRSEDLLLFTVFMNWKETCYVNGIIYNLKTILKPKIIR